MATADIAKLHRKIGARAAFAANRTLTILSSMFAWAMQSGEIPTGPNPCQGIKRFRERRREVFLSAEQMERLGAAIREAETEGIPWEPDAEKKAKHAPRSDRRVRLSPFTAGALRLPLFTGARQREILDPK
ncbi:hypothetical protein [Xanthobacter sp. KR7-225]|uniref:hypothetical protein n=1 Tax=Xanthobacter sp. KR7-225 TaxID=3156613 RepID=UPI0032B4FB02